MNTRNSNSKRRRSPTSTAELDLDAEAEGDVDDDNDMDDGDDTTTADAATNVSNDPATHLSKTPVSLKSPNSNMTLKDTKVRTTNEKTRKRREELSVSACKCMKTEIVQVLVKFTS
jgi:hypothetical protein